MVKISLKRITYPCPIAPDRSVGGVGVFLFVSLFFVVVMFFIYCEFVPLNYARVGLYISDCVYRSTIKDYSIPVRRIYQGDSCISKVRGLCKLPFFLVMAFPNDNSRGLTA